MCYKGILRAVPIGESWLLLLVSLGAANWMLETKVSLFEFSEVFQFEEHYVNKDRLICSAVRGSQIK